MSDLHHRRIEQLQHLERGLFRDLVTRPAVLGPRELDVLRYAFAMARLGELRCDHGDVDLFDDVAPFRHWFVEQLEFFAAPRTDASRLVPRRRDQIDWQGINAWLPTLETRVDEVRGAMLQRRSNEFSAERLDDELCHRQLVLVLGGGGGSGYPHMGVFALLSDLGLMPGMIVGSSMGALLGLFRSISFDYDPMATAMGLPRPREFRRVFSPYRGYSRFGFPGVFELKMRPVATEIFTTLLGRSIPTLSELPIPFRPVVTGLRSGIGLALTEVERDISRSERAVSPLRFGRRFGLFARTIQIMLQNPRFLAEVVFGSDEGLEHIDAVDAVGFSCAVPGFIHYDIFRSDAEAAPILRKLCQDRGFFRITDGGVVANVPARIAWNCVQKGEITSRNAFIMSFDAFSPQANLNAPFIPVQQLIRTGVLEHRRYSNLHITYRNPPSPVKLLHSFDALQHVIADTRSQLAPHSAYIALMTRRIPRWNQLRT